MSIRAAKPQDALSLTQLVTSLAHFYLEETAQSPSAELPEWFAATIERNAFEARIKSTEYLNLVYEQAGEVKGYIAIKLGEQPFAAHLYHLFVHESIHDQGIARQLWRQAQAHLPEVSRYSLRSSLFAVPVYEKLGFQISGAAGDKDGIGFQPMALEIPQ